MSTNIEWTNETWNPTTGCAKVSAGCKNCYAETMSKRLAAMGQQKYQGILTESGRFNGTVRTHDDTLRIPFTWSKPRKVFVDSMSDLFHADVPFGFIDKVFAVMALTPQHTYQILTKRPDRMEEYLTTENRKGIIKGAAWEMLGYMPNQNNVGMKARWPLPNVWLGTSVEDQAAADARIPHLLRCPAAVRFLSCEPLLGKVDFGLIPEEDEDERRFASQILSGIHWVIAGGESGPNARIMHPDWARGLRDQCQAAGVAFFFKQWGEWAPIDQCRNADGSEMKMHDRDDRLVKGKHRTGRTLDGRTHDEFPKEANTPNEGRPGKSLLPKVMELYNQPKTT